MPDDSDKAVRAEVQAILRHATIHQLRDEADELASMLRSLEPTPTLDHPVLDADPAVRERQLILLWLVERRFRRRLQDNLRRALELIAA